MAEYILKSALVAEIKWLDALYHTSKDLSGDLFIQGLFCFLDTLEVKEVNLEEEINKYICDNFFGSQTMGFFANRTKEEPNDQDIALCAKHFFELGLKAQHDKVKEVDLELIIGWFDHIAQIADDRMTLTKQRMTDSHALDEIKCLAKNSSEFITKHYKAQKGGQ